MALLGGEGGIGGKRRERGRRRRRRREKEREGREAQLLGREGGAIAERRGRRWRWPDIERGKFSLQEEQTIIRLHALLGNRWSAIATYLPKRTDNDIKNYWNTHLKKRLTKMGIDPVTHKPKTDALGSGSGNPKDASNLSHMAQWESARLETEARLVKESKLVVSNNKKVLPHHHQLDSASGHQFVPKAGPVPPCLDVLKVWQGAWSTTKPTQNNHNHHNNNNNMMACMMAMDDLEFPTSTLSFPDHAGVDGNFLVQAVGLGVEPLDHQFGKSTAHENHYQHYHHDNNNTMSLHDIAFGACTESSANIWFNANNMENVTSTTTTTAGLANIMEGFVDVFVYNSVDDDDDLPHSSVGGGREGSSNDGGGDGYGSCAGASGIF
ncbi:hypothetical protein TIFTF001_011111 [Ficus carica]|uniref:Uncharacterized protein n=1 Tax=Ficus carica TaxID=3494 RepID=A0AA87ZR33_FICCA|nr:hypothetical protein TIFTF001_011111 [Ficus carica]